MTTDLSPSFARPTRNLLLASFGPDPLSVESLFEFCRVPAEVLARLREIVAPEPWGEKDFVLLKCLAVDVRLAIEQGRYVWRGPELVLCAGNLLDAAGSSPYLGFVRGEDTPWVLQYVGERPHDVESLAPADPGPWPALEVTREVVLACDLAFLRSKVGLLASLPLVTQAAALAGAISWSLRRGLAVRQVHGPSRGYFAPVHLASREGAADIVAPIQVQSRRLVVRTLLDPRAAYAPARAVVQRHEDLPAWLRASWEPPAEESAPAAAQESPAG